MKDIRVYMFMYLFPPEYTGASIQSLNLAKALRRDCGVQVTFVTGVTTSDIHIKDNYDGFRVIRLRHSASNSNLSLMIYWIKVVYVLVRDFNKYDIIHDHGILLQNNILSILGNMLGKKTLVKTTLSDEVERLGDVENAGFENKFNYFALSKFNYIVALSKVIKNKLISASIPSESVFIIPNGVDLVKFSPPKKEYEKNELRGKFNLPEESVIFSYIGVIHKRKNIDWMIKEWLFHFKNKNDVYLLIAGPDPRKVIMSEGGGGQKYVDEIKKLVAQLKGEDKIIFLPFRMNVEDYFKVSDFFLNPSKSEGLSNSMLEAMACGVVPIVSRTSGAEDVVSDRINGFLFDVGSSNDFSKILLELEANDFKKEVLSAQAVRTIENQFSIDAIAQKYLQVYKR